MKLAKLRRWLSQSQKPNPEPKLLNASDMTLEEFIDEVTRKGQVADMLNAIMVDSENMCSCPSSKGQTVSYGQLAEFPPTQVRNICKALHREPTTLRYYSDKTLEKLLVEWEGDITACRKANPTILLTKRPEYARKKDGKYFGISSCRVDGL